MSPPSRTALTLSVAACVLCLASVTLGAEDPQVITVTMPDPKVVRPKAGEGTPDQARAVELETEGLQLAGTQSFPQALAAFEEAMELAEPWTNLLYGACVAAFHTKKFTKAEDYCKRALELSPLEREPRMFLAHALSEQGKDRHDDAQEQFERYVSLSGSDATSLSLFGKFLSSKRRKHKDAIEKYEEALKWEETAFKKQKSGEGNQGPNGAPLEKDAQIRAAYAETLDKMKRYHRSADWWQKAVAIEPDNTAFRMQYAALLTKKLGSANAPMYFQEAVDQIESAKRVDPTNPIYDQSIGNLKKHLATLGFETGTKDADYDEQVEAAQNKRRRKSSKKAAGKKAKQDL